MRVLIVKVSSMGDIIHTLPAVTDARHFRPELRFDWVVEESFREIPAWHPAVDKVIPVAIRRWRKQLRKTWADGEIAAFRRDLKEHHYDLVIDPQGLIKSGIISRMARGLTVGLSNHTIKEPLATLFYNQKYSVPKDMHAVQRIRELFSRTLSYHYDKSVVDYGLDTDRIGLSRLDREEAALVFLHGTTWNNKLWPEMYWRELARLASASGYRVKFPWGSEVERARAQRLAAGLPGASVLDKQSLSGLAAHISCAAGVVAMDTGLAHLAAALEVPTVSLYGPTDPALSGTYGPHQKHLLPDLSCAPCMRRHCEYQGPAINDSIGGESFTVRPPCFARHRPEAVLETLEALIRNRRLSVFNGISI